MARTEISLTLEDGVTCQIFTHGHIVTADDPVDAGAEDEGPTPLEYLLAAIGSSAAIAVKRAAQRLGIEIEEIQVQVSWPASHRRLLDPGEELPRTAIRRELRVRVTRDISETERDALLDAAKSCPVDRSLEGGPRIEDALYILGYAAPDEGVAAG